MRMLVDDIKIIRVKNFGIISQEMEKLMTIFKIVDIRPMSFYLGFKIS